jgi:hypothetical protein
MNEEECQEDIVADCLEFVDAETSAGRRFDASAGAECNEDIGLKIDDCTIVDATALPPEYPYCALFWGDSPPGGACVESSDCAPSPDGEVVCGPAGMGECVVVPRADIGEACNDASLQGPYCDAGTWCDARTGTCAAPGKRGDACEPSDLWSCDAPLYCSPTTKTCTTPALPGAPCEQYFVRSTCVAGTDCQNEEATCQPSLLDEFSCP